MLAASGERATRMTRRTSSASGEWSLTSGTAEVDPPLVLPCRQVLSAVARRGLPGVFEASLVPAAIFLATTAAFASNVAMVAVFAWGIAVVLRRLLSGRQVPSLVVLGLVGLTVKTLVGLMSGSTFVYFLQPVATTVVIGALFFGSALIGRPIIARIAHDFCPLSSDVAARPAVMELFVGLTVLWATVQFVNAGTTVGMLLSLPTNLFVVLRPVASLALSAAAIAITVRRALATAQREQLVFASS